MDSLKELEEVSRKLKAEKRAKLAEVLLESLHEPLPEVEAAWAAEIEERVAAYDRVESQTYPAEDVLAEARRIPR